MSKRGAPAGATIGIVLATKLKALVYWCRECKQNGQRLDSHTFTPEALEEALERLELEGSKVDSPPDLLPKEKFDPLKWVSWYERVTNHLSQLKGHNGTALSYVIRKKESWPKGIQVKRGETALQCQVGRTIIRRRQQPSMGHASRLTVRLSRYDVDFRV